MNKDIIKNCRKYIAAAVIMAAGTAWIHGIAEAESAAEVLGVLSDCFLVPGALLGGIGLIGWIRTQGLFDTLSFAKDMIKNRLTHPQNRDQTYYDYKMKKEETRKETPKEMLLTGGVCLGLSIVFLILYLILS